MVFFVGVLELYLVILVMVDGDGILDVCMLIFKDVDVCGWVFVGLRFLCKVR